MLKAELLKARSGTPDQTAELTGQKAVPMQISIPKVPAW
jgi:hypothetical protein